MKVVLRNTSRVFSATIKLTADRNVTASDSGVFGCMWAGITRQKVELAAGETKTLDLTAAFVKVRDTFWLFQTHSCVAVRVCRGG